jgi:hypothetical protein
VQPCSESGSDVNIAACEGSVQDELAKCCSNSTPSFAKASMFGLVSCA